MPEKKKDGGRRSTPPAQAPEESPPSPKLRLKRVGPPDFPSDFAAGVAAEGDRFAFMLSDHVVAEQEGEACTLFLSWSAITELCAEAAKRTDQKILQVGGPEQNFRCELPLRHVRVVDTGAYRVVLATWEQVLFALQHPRP